MDKIIKPILDSYPNTSSLLKWMFYLARKKTKYLTEEPWMTFPCGIYKIFSYLWKLLQRMQAFWKVKAHSEFWELLIRTLLVLLDLRHFELLHIRKFYTNQYSICILYIINIWKRNMLNTYHGWFSQQPAFLCIR